MGSPLSWQISNHEGGTDSGIDGIELYVTSAVANARWLEAGDRVRRAATYTGEGWSLGGPGDDRVGLVLQVQHGRVRAGSEAGKRLSCPRACRRLCLPIGAPSSGASS